MLICIEYYKSMLRLYLGVGLVLCLAICSCYSKRWTESISKGVKGRHHRMTSPGWLMLAGLIMMPDGAGVTAFSVKKENGAWEEYLAPTCIVCLPLDVHRTIPVRCGNTKRAVPNIRNVDARLHIH